MRITITEERILPWRLYEFAPRTSAMQRVVAAHIPRQNPQLRKTARIDARGVHRHVDGLSIIPVRVASVGAIEEEFAGRVVGEERREHISVVTIHVAEIIKAESGVVPSTKPPRVADVLLVVALTVREVVGGVCLSAVKGEGLGIAIETDDAVDIIAGKGLRYYVGVEGVKEIIRLVWEGWR